MDSDGFEKAWFGEPFEVLEGYLSTMRDVREGDWEAYEGLEYEDGVVDRLEGLRGRVRRHWRCVREMMVMGNMGRRVAVGDEMDVE